MNGFVSAAVNPLGTGVPAIDQQLVANAPDARARAQEAAREVEQLRKHISPEGSPPVPMNRLLDERRHKYLIPDQAFEYCGGTAFDRVFTWQVSRHTGDTKGEGSLIIMPETTKAREQDMACLGVIVGAGLTSLDQLKSHGIDEGHLVVHAKNVIFRLPIATIGGKDYYLTVLTAGDIIASCDLARLRAERKVRIKENKLEDGSIEHVHIDENGKAWHPAEPFVGS